MDDALEKPKFCKDCKYFTLGSGSPSLYAKCAHPSVLDKISGGTTSYCLVNRTDSSECGAAAKLFEPKLP